MLTSTTSCWHAAKRMLTHKTQLIAVSNPSVRALEKNGTADGYLIDVARVANYQTSQATWIG